MGLKSVIKKMLLLAPQMLAPAVYPFKVRWDAPEPPLTVLSDYSPDPGGSCLHKNELLEPVYDLEIIIPCYNVERYVAECIDSVLKQTCSYKVHCTVIDDGSTDKTGEIVDVYESDARVTVIHQVNKGLSGSRNTGLQRIRAAYITFLDSDDTVADGSLEQMCLCAFAQNADIVQGGVQYFSSAGGGNKEKLPTGHITKTRLLGYPWGKLFRGSLFEKVAFPEGYWFEDSLMRQVIFNLAAPDRIYSMDIPFYRYRKNPNGITSTSVKKRKSLDSLWITLRLFEDRKKLGLAVDQDYYEYMLHMAALTYQRILQQPKLIKKAFFCAFSDFLSQNFAGYTSKKDRLFEKAIQEKRYLLFKVLAGTR